ncbi:MAG TPA: ABC transporter ATP-binding protein [Labilithrix sp.]|nr:ABC transporter ATP-binding protein [Labilithrix sp.]
MKAVVETSRVTKAYGEGDQVVSVLNGISFYALRGEFVMLVGPSGSGKTTFLSILGCVLKPSSGSVKLFDYEVGNLPESRLPAIRRNLIGFIFQGSNLIASLTAEENIVLQLNMRGVGGGEARREAAALLDRVGLTKQKGQKPSELSGGQRQRVAIARAVAGHPPLICADEPTASLDQDSGISVTRLLKEIAVERNHTVIAVTHDPRIFQFADRIENLENGRIIRSAEASMSINIRHFMESK